MLARIGAVRNKRARFVLDHIVANGTVTTEDLKNAGYDHPPRAARDVRELGFPLKTVRIKSSNGRAIAAYALDFQAPHEMGKFGRTSLAKKFQQQVLDSAGKKCQLCGAQFNLQLDHRVPYEVMGERKEEGASSYQVLCGSCNRKKSWVCEHCENWLKLKKPRICRSCYWANSNNYRHIAMNAERRVELVWSGDETASYEKLRERAAKAGTTIADQIKIAIKPAD